MSYENFNHGTADEAIAEEAASVSTIHNHEPIQPTTAEAEAAVKATTATKAAKKPRIKAVDLELERLMVFEELDKDSNTSPTKLAIDLGIPEDRVSKHKKDWYERDAPVVFRRLSQVGDTLNRRLKRPNGAALKSDSLLRVEVAEDGLKIIISVYERG